MRLAVLADVHDNLPAVEQARDRSRPVVIAGRCPSGRVWDSSGYPGTYRSLVDLECLFAPEINGQKARIRLMAVLVVAQTGEEAASLWEEGGP